MAILLKEEIKSQIGLILLAVILVFLLFFLARDLIIKIVPEEEVIIVGPFKEIVIKEDVLKNELLGELLPLELIVPAPEMGRENPFLPY